MAVEEWRKPSNGKRIEEYGYGLPETTLAMLEMTERRKGEAIPDIANNDRETIREVSSNELTEGMRIVVENGGMNEKEATLR